MLFVFAMSTAGFARPLCHTPTMRVAPAFSASVTGPYRPAAVGFVDSALYPVRVHYRREQDADRAANLVLPALETSWAIEMDAVGWPAPPSDGLVGGSGALDVYLTNEGTGGGAYVWGFGPDVVPDDDWFSVASYMALDEAIPDDEMLSYVAHELNHVSQYTIDAWEWSTFVWESTAEVMADVVDDDGDVYIEYGAMPDFQEFPFLSLVFDGYRPAVIAYDPYSYYEYGGIIFGMFVEQRYGVNDGSTLLAMWEALGQPTASPEPDFLDALAEIEPSGSLAALYTEFAVWRMFTGDLDDGAHFEEASLWGPSEQVGFEATLSLAQLDGYAATPQHPPYDLGTSYYAIDLGAGTDELLQIDVTGDAGAQWGVAWAVWRADGSAISGSTLGAEGEAVQAVVPLADGVRAQIGVVNAGPAAMDAEVGQPRRSFDLALALLPPPDPGTTDTGTAPVPTDTAPTTTTDEPPGADPDNLTGGCACAGTPGPAPLLPLAPLALLLAARRRAITRHA